MRGAKADGAAVGCIGGGYARGAKQRVQRALCGVQTGSDQQAVTGVELVGGGRQLQQVFPWSGVGAVHCIVLT